MSCGGFFSLFTIVAKLDEDKDAPFAFRFSDEFGAEFRAAFKCRFLARFRLLANQAFTWFSVILP